MHQAKLAAETERQIRYQVAEQERAAQSEKLRKGATSPPGSIPNLPQLLEARRVKYQIPDMFFESQACNTRVNVFQIDADAGDFYGDEELIAKADIARERSLESTPQGILMSGGCKAMDHMYGNGYWPGHIVNFVQMNPYRKPIGKLGGHNMYVLVMSCNDITDSQDLARALRAGTVKYARREWVLSGGGKGHEHYLQDTETGEVWDPGSVEMLEDEKNG